MTKKKKIFILGGLGVVGKILIKGLKDRYELYIGDREWNDIEGVKVIRTDGTNLEDLKRKIPQDVAIIINLIALPEMPKIVDEHTFSRMMDVYLKATYNVLQISKERSVGKVIFASTNHVTNHYELDGNSLLNREISTADYPFSEGVYGTLKLAAENLGHVFHLNEGLSVINIRIGTVISNEKEMLTTNPRSMKTILSHHDAVDLFDKAISSNVNYGTYYGVSDNPGKPWSIENAISELGYKPEMNSDDILNDDLYTKRGY